MQASMRGTVMPLTLITSERFIDHVTPAGHPERPERAEVFNRVAEAFKSTGGRVIEPRPAGDDDLHRVHTREHVSTIVASRGRATMIDEDTFTSPDSEEVARLAAGGLTNRQVARELFISPHTVGFHMRQIYRKLDIRSRVYLARVVPT